MTPLRDRLARAMYDACPNVSTWGAEPIPWEEMPAEADVIRYCFIHADACLRLLASEPVSDAVGHEAMLTRHRYTGELYNMEDVENMRAAITAALEARRP